MLSSKRFSKITANWNWKNVVAVVIVAAWLMVLVGMFSNRAEAQDAKQLVQTDQAYMVHGYVGEGMMVCTPVNIAGVPPNMHPMKCMEVSYSVFETLAMMCLGLVNEDGSKTLQCDGYKEADSVGEKSTAPSVD
jgi:hypothetical protein